MARSKAAAARANVKAQYDFWKDVLEKASDVGCWFKPLVGHKCDGPSDPCHIIDKQGLKTAGRFLEKPELLVYDPRNGLPGCRAIHTRFDQRMMRVYQDELPEDFWEFLAEWEKAIGTPGILQEKLNRKCPTGGRSE